MKNPPRIRSILAACLGVAVMMIVGFGYLCNFPVEERSVDGSFKTMAIGWELRSDILTAVLENGGGPIRTATYSGFLFHAFDVRGHVFIIDVGESGATPPVRVVEVENYSGDPHAHHIKVFPSGA